jgi:hypothetical protein
MNEMKDVALEAKQLEGAALRRANHAHALLVTPPDFDPVAAAARLDGLLGAQL